MERRKALALTSLLMVLLASFTLITPTSANPGGKRFLIMGGTLDACTQLGPFPVTFWMTPFQSRDPWLTPGVMQQNVTFSNAWTLAGYGQIVNLTVEAETFTGVYHEWYDTTTDIWFNLDHYMKSGEDGYGWIFLEDQKGDVDCYTFHNDTGAYWGPESDFAGLLAASVGSAPSPGDDGVAGTADDGFGDGTLDPAGSSILILPSYVRCEFWTGSAWAELFDVQWPIIFTTETSYGIVDESNSDLDGTSATKIGKPQELLQSGTTPPDPNWNAYITYVSCWGMLDVYTPAFTPPWLDVFYALEIYSVREDEVVWGDVNTDGVVDSTDDGSFGASFGAIDEFFGHQTADPNFDARCDFNADNVVDSTDDGTFGVWWGSILLG